MWNSANRRLASSCVGSPVAIRHALPQLVSSLLITIILKIFSVTIKHTKISLAQNSLGLLRWSSKWTWKLLAGRCMSQEFSRRVNSSLARRVSFFPETKMILAKNKLNRQRCLNNIRLCSGKKCSLSPSRCVFQCPCLLYHCRWAAAANGLSVSKEGGGMQTLQLRMRVTACFVRLVLRSSSLIETFVCNNNIGHSITRYA